MCSDSVVSLRNVSKVYYAYAHPLHRLIARINGRGAGSCKEFHALDNISFDIRKGETIGIIGRNGSGKSTLLQLICGIRQPTSGDVTVNGRISALLELGSGFQPEFTGRENVFLQGAIMGFSHAEMAERFADIADFADIDEYINQPVKTYSSGMFVRLAFAVAISVEPDILVVDEALSVGDEAFQRKCFSRIQSIQERGGTILIVSHSAATVLELCSRAILLDNSELLIDGKPKIVIDRYHKLLYAPQDRRAAIANEIRTSHGEETDSHHYPAAATSNDFDAELIPHSTISYEPRGASIRNARILDEREREVNILANDGHYTFCYDVLFEEHARQVRFTMLIKTKTGYELGGLGSHPADAGIPEIGKGSLVTVRLPFHCHLLPGTYFLNSGVLGRGQEGEEFLHRVIDILAFKVRPDQNSMVGGVVDFSIRDNPSTASPSVTFQQP